MSPFAPVNATSRLSVDHTGTPTFDTSPLPGTTCDSVDPDRAGATRAVHRGRDRSTQAIAHPARRKQNFARRNLRQDLERHRNCVGRLLAEMRPRDAGCGDGKIAAGEPQIGPSASSALEMQRELDPGQV